MALFVTRILDTDLISCFHSPKYHFTFNLKGQREIQLNLFQQQENLGQGEDQKCSSIKWKKLSNFTFSEWTFLLGETRESVSWDAINTLLCIWRDGPKIVTTPGPWCLLSASAMSAELRQTLGGPGDSGQWPPEALWRYYGGCRNTVRTPGVRDTLVTPSRHGTMGDMSPDLAISKT